MKTRDDIARMLSISVRQLTRMDNHGYIVLPAVVGRRRKGLLYDDKEVEAFVASNPLHRKISYSRALPRSKEKGFATKMCVWFLTQPPIIAKKESGAKGAPKITPKTIHIEEIQISYV
jgi:hypothetical protein